MSLNRMCDMSVKHGVLCHFLLVVWADVCDSGGVSVRDGSDGFGTYQQKENQMPVELKKQRDGSLRPTWYGRYEVNGRKQYLNLDVKVAGNPPASLSLRDEGDAAFE